MNNNNVLLHFFWFQDSVFFSVLFDLTFFLFEIFKAKEIR